MVQNMGVADAEAGEATFDWTLSLASLVVEDSPEGEAPTRGLVGNLFISENDWHLGVTALLMVDSRGPVEEHLAHLDDDKALEELAPWAGHVLWDHVALVARTIAGAAAAPLNIPQLTPTPRLPLTDGESPPGPEQVHSGI
jgi:hypothetical protein